MGNIVGFGQAVKFQVKTPKREAREQVPADVPAEKEAEDQGANATYVEATKGKKLPPSGEQMEALEEKGEKSSSAIICQ